MSAPLPPKDAVGVDFAAASSSGSIGWLIGGLLLLLALIGGVLIAWWLFFNIVVSITITDQATGVQLPASFQASTDVSNSLDVSMRGEIDAKVPFDQVLTVPFAGRYDFDVEMAAKVPLNFDVTYQGVLPINTMAEVTIRTGLNYKNLKALRNLVIQTAIPLKFLLPVDLKIPVSEEIDLIYNGPLSADINQNIKTRVNTVLNARLPIEQELSIPVTAAIPLQVRPDAHQTRLILSQMQVDLKPSSMLKLKWAEDTDGPTRVENPYGPLDGVYRKPHSPP
ncbi:MAG: hypothetical protein ACPGZP_10565 [Panacagrimonas sp.]